MSLPTADDLFRPTANAEVSTSSTNGEDAESAGEAVKPKRPSGRVRHDEKMTVYITSEELLDLEHARLALRRTHGLAVDRGRLVRAALSMALADLEENGASSDLVRRLSGA